MNRKVLSRVILLGFLFFIFSFGFLPKAFAREIKIVFTGQSYAMLYPCTCPIEPDGGVARRATLIKKIRSSSPDTIVVEAGNSFASGAQDQNSQNYESDSRRTDIYVRSLKQMNYDAILLSSQEFSFGIGFIEHYPDVPFVSSNIGATGRPDVLKDLGWIKVGILGLTDSEAVAKGVQQWQPPVQALEKRVADLKKKGAAIIILLSSLKPQEDQELLAKLKGIDVVINGSPSYGSVSLSEQDGVLYLTTWWEARKAGVLTLDISGSKIVKKNLEERRLSSELVDDESILTFLPACFRDPDCKKKAGFSAQCENGSTPAARCVYLELPQVSMTIIRPRLCRSCRIEPVVNDLKGVFGKLKVDYLTLDDKEAREIIKEFNIDMLPAYLFHNDIEKSGIFASLSTSLEKGKNYYRLKPQASGVSYFLNRQEQPKRLDIFFDYSNPQLGQLLQVLKAFHEKHRDIHIHLNFIAAQDPSGNFVSRGGTSEVEEFKRVASIDDLYPEKVLDYLICRAGQKESSWWDECATTSKIDAAKVKTRVFSVQSKDLMVKRTKLTQELAIASGPTFLLDNKEIFSMVNAPSLEELEKTVLGKQVPTLPPGKKESK